MSGRTDTGQLAARRRLAAVGRARANLAGWQPSVQRLADLVVEAAGVPVSVVSLVTADSQIMLGCAGGAGAVFEIPLSASLCREVVVSGLPFITRDTVADERFAGSDPVLVHGIRAYAGFPVADEDGLILGVVSIAAHEPHEWTVAQLSTADNAAQLFAELLGGANAAAARGAALAHQREHRWAEQFRRCGDTIARSMAEAPDAGTAGQAVLTSVTEALGWPYAELWRYDPAAEVLRAAAHCHRDGFGPAPHLPPRLSPGAGLAGLAWSAPGPVWVDEAGLDGLLAQDPAADVLRSAVVVPVAGEDGRGAFVLCSATAEQPDDLLSVLLTGIAAQFGQHLQRRRAEGLARQLARSRHEYVRLVGHELRTPLTSIAACTDLLTAFGDELPGDARELLAAVTRNSDRLRHIINALLDLAALDSGHVVLHRTTFDLAAAVREAAAGPFERQVRVRAATPDGAVVEADEPRIRAVLRTLVGNAVTYSHPGGAVTVTLTSAAGHACLTVADTGVGIPPDELDGVFERFQRSSWARDLGIPGLGLSLATSRAVLERHQGTVTLRETPGGGTTAEVHLPLHPH